MTGTTALTVAYVIFIGVPLLLAISILVRQQQAERRRERLQQLMSSGDERSSDGDG